MTMWTRAMVGLSAVPLVLAAVLTAPTEAEAHHGRPFTIAVIPDTQIAVQNKPELFYAQTRWILDHQRSRNIRFVVHLGDLVEWPARTSDWQRAATAMHRLDRKVPYTVTLGNHDLDAWACTPPETCDPWAAIAHDRSTVSFNRYFPRSTFQRRPGFGGSYPRRAMDNSYFTFTAGGVRWLTVALKFAPTAEELAWANRIISQHPGDQVILDAHEYQNGSERSPVGDRIWNALVRTHANVRIVLSGHYVNAGVRTDRGDRGNTVYQIQADYQTYNPARVNDNSYLRLMEFDVPAGTVSVRTFSPYCAATGECPPYLTDPRNEFSLTGVRFPAPGD